SSLGRFPGGERCSAGPPSPQFPRREPPSQAPHPLRGRRPRRRIIVRLAKGDGRQRRTRRGSSPDAHEPLDERRLQALRIRSRGFQRRAQLRDPQLLRRTRRGVRVEVVVRRDLARPAAQQSGRRRRGRDRIQRLARVARRRPDAWGSRLGHARGRLFVVAVVRVAQELSDAPPRVARRWRFQRRFWRAALRRKQSGPRALRRQVVRDCQHREHGTVRDGPARMSCREEADEERDFSGAPGRREQEDEPDGGRAREAVARDPGQAAVGVVGQQERVARPEAQDLAHGRVLGLDVVARFARFKRLEAEPAAPGRHHHREHVCSSSALPRAAAVVLTAPKSIFFGWHPVSRVAFLDACNGAAPRRQQHRFSQRLIYERFAPQSARQAPRAN
ncbi:unnamed protein product, partial [Pelagomonas calceolata]